MVKIITTLTLDNGLVLEVIDESTNCYTDLRSLKIVIRVTITVTLSTSRPSPRLVPITRRHKMPWYPPSSTAGSLGGVREDEPQRNMQRPVPVRGFKDDTLPYLRHPSFPERIVKKRVEELTQETKDARLRER